MKKFTEREEELMEFLWAYGEPLTSFKMVELCKDRKWKDSYITIMIRSLEKKGALECCGVERIGKKYARTFRPAISKEEYFVRLALSAGVNCTLFAKAAAGLVKKEHTQNQDELIKELEEIIKEFKEREDET